MIIGRLMFKENTFAFIDESSKTCFLSFVLSFLTSPCLYLYMHVCVCICMYMYMYILSKDKLLLQHLFRLSPI